MNREMSPIERDIGTLRHLAQMPFLDRLELAHVSDTPDRTVHDAAASLEQKGLVKSVRHATDLIASTRRLYVTSEGLRWLAERDGMGIQELLQRYPVSGHWRRILLERLDAVGVIYRVASSVAAVGSPLRFRWYRRAPLDAAMVLPDGRTVGVVRQGATSDKTGFSKRVWRLLDEPLPDVLLVLVPDDVRMRHASRILTRSRELVLLALEKNAALTTDEQPLWHLASLNTVVDLRSAMSRVKPNGGLPSEPPLSRPLLPNDLPVLDGGFNVPDHLLPAVLKPAEKRTLDILADWPWITFSNLVGLLGVSPARTSQLTTPPVGAKLACRVDVGGTERFALTDWGLALLARRDRTSVGRLRNQWSMEPVNNNAPRTWRNVSGTRSRLLARNIEHTEAVHRFLAQLVRQAKTGGYQVAQLEPPHRATRHFWHNNKLRSIHPDAFGILRKGQVTWPFFLEWERRAVRPGTMAARLAPYLRYYSSMQPTNDHGTQPIVLIVFDDPLVEANFLGVARNEMTRTRVKVPLWVSYREVLNKVGPLGPAWRNPDHLTPTYAFR